jgi:hypothetical protein
VIGDRDAVALGQGDGGGQAGEGVQALHESAGL